MSRLSDIRVQDLSMGYGGRVVMSGVNFEAVGGSVTAIVGGSGCGKSTLMRHMVGLLEPLSGEVFYGGESFTNANPGRRGEMLRRFGVTYQQGALWSDMTLIENVSLPLEQYSPLSAAEIRDLARLKLALVGLSGFEDFLPSDISGGMRKRAALARALALDPDVLFFDEPSAGLDPVSSRRLDELILRVCESTGAAVIIVTHELASLYAIASQAVFLDVATRTMTAVGDPKDFRDNPPTPAIREFFNGKAPA